VPTVVPLLLWETGSLSFRWPSEREYHLHRNLRPAAELGLYLRRQIPGKNEKLVPLKSKQFVHADDGDVAAGHPLAHLAWGKLANGSVEVAEEPAKT